jgi:hypothetical protein
MTYLCIWITWLVWVPAVMLEKAARDDRGGTSITPVIPVFPMVASMAAWGLNRAGEKFGDYAIGGLHLVILASMLFGCAVSGYRIHINKRTK